MVPHFVLVLDLLSLLAWIIFEGPVTESTIHCASELDGVLWCHDKSFVVVAVVHCLLLKLDRAVYELLHTVGSVDHTIRFVVLGEVTLYFVSNSAWLMLFLEVTPVSPSWSCFFGYDECFKIRIYDEWCSVAIAEISQGELTPLPRFRHHE